MNALMASMALAGLPRFLQSLFLGCGELGWSVHTFLTPCSLGLPRGGNGGCEWSCPAQAGLQESSVPGLVSPPLPLQALPAPSPQLPPHSREEAREGGREGGRLSPAGHLPLPPPSSPGG